MDTPSYMAEPTLHTAKDIEYRVDMTRQYHNLLQKQEDGEEQIYFGDGGMTALLDGKDPKYYLKDELGSPIRLLDQDGELHESYAYDEFGRGQMGGILHGNIHSRLGLPDTNMMQQWVHILHRPESIRHLPAALWSQTPAQDSKAPHLQ